METLVCPIHECTETLAGTFTFLRDDGIPDAAAFYVRCEPAPALSDPNLVAIRERREDAANDQLTEMWKDLQAKGYTHINFTTVKPDPF